MESLQKKVPEDRLTGSIKKPRIGFYLENNDIPNADLRFPEAGNPGIGGSEFSSVEIPYFISSYYHDFDLIIYANVTKYLPDRLTFVQTDDAIDAAQKAVQDSCEILIINLHVRGFNPDFIQTISGSHLKVIVWAHNNPTSQQMEIVANCTNIPRLVCVGREQLDLLRDHPVFYKTTCIFNCIHPPAYAPKHHIVKSGTTVVYMGSLQRGNGFHILAKVWSQVKAQVPEAHLKVIGSAKLYNESTELGRWGIADEEYEREFRPYLSDGEGNPDASVEFLGKLGVEKISVMQQADIGVVNPSGNSETFCKSAVEFQACGTPVISSADHGLLDTVLHRCTGLLAHNERDLTEYIVWLLRDRELRDLYGYNAMKFVRFNFDCRKICDQWQDLFLQVLCGQSNQIYPMKSNVFYHYKILRETMRLVKYYVPPFRIIPSISVITSAIANVKKRKFLS